MIVINARNVNDALTKGISLLYKTGDKKDSRVGPTLDTGPVTTVYYKPHERVLFEPIRDANPFFHFFEALWMLAGRNDVDFVSKLVPRMRDFSDNGQTLHGAYGYRWREHWETDQIESCIRSLRRDPDTRRAVIAMWDPDIDSPFGAGKDYPCNTTIYFKNRGGELDMLVCNRSNDIIWGAYGANVVHMSFLQEYVAGKTGLRIGKYSQVSDSFHAYLPPHPSGALFDKLAAYYESSPLVHGSDAYSRSEVASRTIEADNEWWDRDLTEFFDALDCGRYLTSMSEGLFKVSWFKNTVLPMWGAWQTRDLDVAAQIDASDWRKAAVEWLKRRKR